MQMHATFWHLIHFVMVALLCILWAPGELVGIFQSYHDAHRDRQRELMFDGDTGSLRVSAEGEAGQGKSA
jgi:hypothetical protein